MRSLIFFIFCSSVYANSNSNYFTREKNLKRNLPFSEVVRVDNTLYLSGAIGIRPGGKSIVKGGVGAETKQTLLNIKEILQHYKLTLSNIVKCQVMLRDMSDIKEFNNEYRNFFKAPYPARSTFAVSGLALGAKVEIECIAIFDSK